MNVLAHWHPACLAENLGAAPLRVELAGHFIAVYRTASGKIAALEDECPHRRMKLSLGEVMGERLQCRYHGWTFDCEGQGESPGTPKLHACATGYEVREERGVVWLRELGSQSKFPDFQTDGFMHMCTLEHVANAPLEVALDNFTEIEHTSTIHAIFGYQLERMQEVTVEFRATEDSVRVINAGPPKSLGWFLDQAVGIRKGDLFYDDWTTWFSPVYSVYDHWWADPKTGRESKVRWRLYMFVTPVNDHQSRVTTFSYAKSSWPLGFGGGLYWFKGLMREQLNNEVQLDIDILNSLANYDTSLTGLKLSRFDKVLGLTRERIERIYRGGRKELATAGAR